MVKKVLLASPRGYCAGVERAVDTVEQALELYGAPVYVRKQIVHNAHVVHELEERGAIFVDSEEEVPTARRSSSRRTESPVGAREFGRAWPQHDRRHVPSGDQGARPGSPVRR
jgi:4-hydroxy-3-methylbut-2-enyl diphosphate reductase IspH